MTNQTTELIDTIEKMGLVLQMLAFSPIPIFFLLVATIGGILLLTRKAF